MKFPFSLHCLSVGLGLLPALLAGCGLIKPGPDYQTPPSTVATNWQTSSPILAHGGDLQQLTQWWQQFNDPALQTILTAAQAQSPSLAQAKAHIEQARGDANVAGWAGFPSLDANAGVTRSAVSFGGPALLRTIQQVGLQSSWELDLFGSLARQREVADATLTAAQARWHDARVAVAAETAQAYVQYRYCEQLLAISQTDAQSRAETARLTRLSGQAGFQSPANVALAEASAAEAANLLSQQRAQCDIQIKALVALTALEEPNLRAQLALHSATFPTPRAFSVNTIPAQLLQQRPDVMAAERDLAAASASIGYELAQQYPRLTLSGSITPQQLSAQGQTLSFKTWSIGPSLTLPLFDGGRRTANIANAKAQYEAAELSYKQKARNAVSEVEQALVRLNSVAERSDYAATAASSYQQFFVATQARQQVGFAGLLELEEARRTALNAQNTLLALQQERLLAWIALYRAVGGGWTQDTISSLSSSTESAAVPHRAPAQ